MINTTETIPDEDNSEYICEDSVNIIANITEDFQTSENFICSTVYTKQKSDLNSKKVETFDEPSLTLTTFLKLKIL